MTRISIFAAVATLLIADPAMAETRQTYKSGFWSTFDGTANNGVPVCGMVASGPNRAIGVKYFLGSDSITVHIVKDNWSIPNGTQVHMKLQFSGETPWNVRGRGYGNLIEFDIRGENIGLFMREFRNSARGAISFLNGNEEGWTINLTGSSTATSILTRCMNILTANRGAPTQPFSGTPAAPSQPFTPSSPSGGKFGPPPTNPGRST
jgi:hypothetical protein